MLLCHCVHLQTVLIVKICAVGAKVCVFTDIVGGVKQPQGGNSTLHVMSLFLFQNDFVLQMSDLCVLIRHHTEQILCYKRSCIINV